MADPPPTVRSAVPGLSNCTDQDGKLLSFWTPLIKELNPLDASDSQNYKIRDLAPSSTQEKDTFVFTLLLHFKHVTLSF